MSVIIPAITMIIAAAYAYVSVASDAGKIPMQWTLNGQASLLMQRQLALAIIPAIGILALIILHATGIATPLAEQMVGLLFFAIQMLHLALVHRWHDKSRV